MGGAHLCVSCKKPKKSGELFHIFPIKRDVVCRKWEIAARVNATEHSLLCADHFDPDSYIYTGSRKLKLDAIPSIFSHAKTQLHRKPPVKRTIDDERKPALEEKPSSSPSKTDLRGEIAEKEEIIMQQRKKIKLMHQQVRRHSTTITNLKSAVSALKEKNLLEPKIAENILETFPGLDGQLIANHLHNLDRENRGNRYSDEVKRFALTVHFYSPKAFKYLRTIFNLPHPRSIRVWTSSVKCDPGFFEDVFLHLRKMISDDPINAECALIFDGMAIRKETVNNLSTGNMDGFVDLGQGIAGFEDEDDDDDDTIASEALIFLFSALRSSWKYVIGYVLIDKLGAEKQYGLVARALELAIDHGIEVKTVTCDGTATKIIHHPLFAFPDRGTKSFLRIWMPRSPG